MGFLLSIVYWLIGAILFVSLILFAISLLKALWDTATGKTAILWFFPFGIIEAKKKKKPKPKAPERFIPEKPKVAKPKKPRPMWLQILLMTPAEYMEYRRRKKEK